MLNKYGSELWIFLLSYSRRLEAFHMRCQRQILCTKLQDMVCNTAIAEKTGLPSVTAIIDARRTALFGHVARFDDRVPTRSRLRLAIDVHLGMPPSPNWKRPCGRPRDMWLKTVPSL